MAQIKDKVDYQGLGFIPSVEGALNKRLLMLNVSKIKKKKKKLAEEGGKDREENLWALSQSEESMPKAFSFFPNSP